MRGLYDQPDEDIERAMAEEAAEQRYDDSFWPDEENPPAAERDEDEWLATETMTRRDGRIPAPA